MSSGPSRFASVLLVAGAPLLLAAACDSRSPREQTEARRPTAEEETETDTGRSAARRSPTPSTRAPAAEETVEPRAEGTAGEATVELSDIEFQPSRIQAAPGQTIRFVNRDPFEHDVYVVDAANTNRVVQPATLVGPDESITVTPEERALYSVYCTIHGGMEAKLTTSGSFQLTAEQRARAEAQRAALPPIVGEGEELFWGPAQCHQCHRVGDRGDALRGPDLKSIGLRASAQAERLGLGTGTDYIVQSILDSSAYVVEGYSDDMATVYEPPIDLDAEQLTAIVAYLQSQGGEVDTWGIEISEDRLDPPRPYDPFAAGDPERGRKVFFEVAQCNSCHAVAEEKPVAMGPDLGEIGAYRSWSWLIESILEPNAEIGANWKSATVTLKSGETRSGVLQRRTGAAVELMTAGNAVESIPADQVQTVEVEESSRMPGDYDEILTYQQMGDLVAYLKSLRGSPRSGQEVAERSGT